MVQNPPGQRPTGTLNVLVNSAPGSNTPPAAEESLSILIPVYNESATLETALRRLWRTPLPLPCEVIVIDDGSTDHSAGIVEELKPECPWPLQLVRHPHNRGKTAALRSGLPQVTGTLTLVYDADLEYDPADIPRLLAPILQGRADAVYGSRTHGYERRVLFFWHALGNRLVTGFANLFANLNLSDMETCFKLIRTDLLRSMRFRSQHFGFEPEVTVKLGRLGCRVYEVPIHYSGRSYEEGKKIGWWDAVRAMGTILRAGLLESPLAGRDGAGRFAISRLGPYYAEIVHRVAPVVGQHILDVGSASGAGPGRHLLQRRLLMLTDPDPAAARRLATRYSHRPNVHVASWDPHDPGAAPPEGPFDTIFCFHLLERAEHDERLLQALSLRLTPGGHIVALMPAHPWLYGPLDRAMGRRRRYRRREVETTAREAGLDLEQLRVINALGAVGWWLAGTLLRARSIRRPHVRLFRLTLPLLRLERIVPPPFGLSWLAVFRHPASEPSINHQV